MGPPLRQRCETTSASPWPRDLVADAFVFRKHSHHPGARHFTTDTHGSIRGSSPLWLRGDAGLVLRRMGWNFSAYGRARA